MGKTFRNEKHVWDDDPGRFEKRFKKTKKRRKKLVKESRNTSKDKILDMWMTRDTDNASV
tara:strand:+ start:19689 stop:19868 length:180 start_codon:yes stop_codon:yes gene_type:complete